MRSAADEVIGGKPPVIKISMTLTLAAETTVQQTYRLHRKTDPSFVKEDALFRNTYMSRREYKSWSWRLKRRMTLLVKANSNLTDLPTDSSSVRR
jgi:hypothetical protein